MESKWLICVASWLVKKTTKTKLIVMVSQRVFFWKFQFENVQLFEECVVPEDGDYPPSKLLGDLKSFLCLPLSKEIIWEWYFSTGLKPPTIFLLFGEDRKLPYPTPLLAIVPTIPSNNSHDFRLRTSSKYHWVFPKNRGTPKWMVYNRKPY